MFRLLNNLDFQRKVFLAMQSNLFLQIGIRRSIKVPLSVEVIQIVDFYPPLMESGGGYSFGVVRPSFRPHSQESNYVARGTIGNCSFSLISFIP
jgi:hypothetical protein